MKYRILELIDKQDERKLKYFVVKKACKTGDTSWRLIRSEAEVEIIGMSAL